MNAVAAGAGADPLPLAQALIRCRSVTPVDDGAIGLLAETLGRLGFTVTMLPFGDGPAGPTPNLFARIGTGTPHLCFAGHTDVVPSGEHGWSVSPFEGTVRDGVLFGRGACDMKGGIAAFVSAAERYLSRMGATFCGSISLLITGDEEGPATDGTVRVLDWMARQQQLPDFCLVGEPTNPDQIGDMIKVGRRGSLNARFAVQGVQGHVAYPHRADNPIHRLLALLNELVTTPLDEGTSFFEPSSLQVTGIDVGNRATNVIPMQAEARLNIRFNDLHTGTSLQEMLRAVCARHAPAATLEVLCSGDAFRTDGSLGLDVLREAVAMHTGREPVLDTGGGTSDARFINRYCAVAEFGLVGRSMHKTDENVPVADLHRLSAIYETLLDRFLSAGALTA